MDTSSSPRLADSNNAVPNPFLALKSRYLVLGTFLMASLGAGSLYALLGEWQVIPKSNEDPISTPVLTIAVLTVMAVSILWIGHQEGLKTRYLFGQRNPKFSILYSVVLVLSLLLFSLGISSVIFYLLSLSFPSYVSQLLENSTLLDSHRSAYPQLYEALMLFLLLVYAPVVEELVFRGILLQRWSVQWGLRSGVIASSILFGALHFNNPIGLTLFGLVMGLLYVRTQSLWVPIGCHALNNLAAVGIDWFSQVASGGQTTTVSDVQELWWMSLILVAVSMPFLAVFVWRSWPKTTDAIPYVTNCGAAGLGVKALREP
ncbi:MAG: lysostaphin resistance A-like protein [Phormidesmis sp.]